MVRLNKNIAVWPQYPSICLEVKRWSFERLSCCIWNWCFTRRANGTMKKENYLQIYQDNLKSQARRLSLECSWVFQKDNDPKHKPKVVMEWLNQARIMVWKCLPKVPTSTPLRICVLQKQVRARKPTNWTEVYQLCHEDWSKIQPETYQKFVNDYLSAQLKWKWQRDMQVNISITVCIFFPHQIGSHF